MILENMIKNNIGNNSITIYKSIYVPNILISEYLLRLKKYFNCSVECYVVALIYIDKLMKKYSEIKFDNYTAHRLFLICLIISIKYLDDEIYTNKFYARASGITLLELNKLEIKTLQYLKYNIFVSKEEYDRYYSHIEKVRINLNN